MCFTFVELQIAPIDLQIMLRLTQDVVRCQQALFTVAHQCIVQTVLERAEPGLVVPPLEELAAAAPQNRDVLYLIAANQRCLNRIHEALATLQRLEQQHPRFSLLYQERGYCYVSLRDAPRGIDAFLQGVDINPALAMSWSMLEACIA